MPSQAKDAHGAPLWSTQAHTEPPSPVWLSSFQQRWGKDTSVTQTLRSPQQSSEMDGSMHPTRIHLKVSVKATLRAAEGQSTALSHPRPDGRLVLVSRHSFSVPSHPSFLFETQVNEKGEKSTEHILFSLFKYAGVLFYNSHLLVLCSSHFQAPIWTWTPPPSVCLTQRW